jgi:hypothetical protein
MRVVITHSKTYGHKLKKVLESAIAAAEKGITLYSTSEVEESLSKLLNRTQSVVKFELSDKKAFIIRGVLIELITVDSYE